MIAALLCLGSWASTFKAAGRWRYELYYFDFSFGFLLCVIVAALTLGSLRSSELTFQDNLLITSYRKMAYALAAGVVFNLGNVVLLAGISVGGLALCVPLAFGTALVIGATWDFALDPRANPLLMFGGVVVVLIAMVLLATAYSTYKSAVQEAARKAFDLDPRSKQAKRRPKQAAAGVGIAFAILGGIVLSFAPRIVGSAAEGENGVAPYGLMLLFAGGLLFSTFLYAPFVINFPIGNTPATLSDYFKASRKQHLFGILGGILLASGLLAALTVKGSAASALLGSGWVVGLEQSAPLVAILWGLLAFHEFRDAGERVRTFVWGGFLLYEVAVALIALAPLYGSR